MDTPSKHRSERPATLRRILHLDMDAFYASVEQRDDPALRGRPVVVGGRPDSRGVVAAASYEARRYGVHSAMPASRAARLCPDAVFVRPDFARYKAVSAELRQILHEATDRIEPLSLDEAFLDVTENQLGFATATEVARHLRARVREQLRLTCSVGVAPVKFVAKIASDYRKPDGLTVVPPERVLEFVHPLPVKRLWGVGPATERRLGDLGVRTIGDLAVVPRSTAEAALGSHGLALWHMAHGVDPRPVRPHRVRKSRSAEHTLQEDLVDLAAIRALLRDQAAEVCEGLRRAGEVGRTVVVKVRYDDFTTVTRSSSLEHPTDDLDVVMGVVLRLLERTEAGARPVRLVGVGLAGLSDPQDDPQLHLPLGVPSSQEAR